MKLSLYSTLFAVTLSAVLPSMALAAGGTTPTGEKCSPCAVTVTNTLTGEQGCHNRETQTSEPGACPTKDPGQ
jgi:hypothetical protein